MLTITLCTKVPPEHIGMQIITMAGDYFTDLGMAGTPPSNALYPIHQAAMMLEMGTYLHAIGLDPLRPIGLLVATDTAEPGIVLGFLKYLPIKGVPDACGVTYMAVRHDHRHKGIAKALMHQLLKMHPHVELTCFVEKVPVYERLGFKPIGVRDSQVRMCTRDVSPDGVMAILNTVELYGTPQVMAVQREQLAKYGAKGIRDAEKRFMRLHEQRTKKAKDFFEKVAG